jgi:hypothetical protein
MFDYQYNHIITSTQTCMAAKERERNELAEAVREFVNNGGRIQQVAPGVASKPGKPKKSISFGTGKRP